MEAIGRVSGAWLVIKKNVCDDIRRGGVLKNGLSHAITLLAFSGVESASSLFLGHTLS
jgi:hypothetical protein